MLFEWLNTFHLTYACDLQCYFSIPNHSVKSHFELVSTFTILPKCQIGTRGPVCISISFTQECVMTSHFGGVKCA
jgi:hypothetical protein